MNKTTVFLKYPFSTFMRGLVFMIPFVCGMLFEHYRTKADSVCAQVEKVSVGLSAGRAMAQKEEADRLVNLNLENYRQVQQWAQLGGGYQRPQGQRIDQVQPLNDIPQSRVAPPQDAFELMRQRGVDSDRSSVQQAVRPNDIVNQLRSDQYNQASGGYVDGGFVNGGFVNSSNTVEHTPSATNMSRKTIDPEMQEEYDRAKLAEIQAKDQATSKLRELTEEIQARSNEPPRKVVNP